MSILIVDDDENSLEMLRDALDESGHTVLSARDGSDALRMFETHDVRLVITDWEMPGLTGPELCREIRRRPSRGYTYIMLLTSHGRSEDIVAGMSAGADDFIVKPFHRAELQVRVRAGLRILSLETRQLVIFALAKLAESRDPETGRHLERVQRYSQVLATQLGQDPRFANEADDEFVRLVYQTSPLHDIGKVGIPDSILLKPDRLSDEEFETMKHHTLLGAQTLEAALRQNPSARFLQVARDIALSHHERFDGRGYPQGLAGEQIPLSARIVALADVYDALTSRRIYKAAYSPHVARDTIRSESGTHFDPAVVEAFLKAEPQFLSIFEELHEAEPVAAPPEVAAPIATGRIVAPLVGLPGNVAQLPVNH
ncbi:MAG: response regulator [Planctomycetia bacterium]|nr:response regulator [Planctomycetia bacterium]